MNKTGIMNRAWSMVVHHQSSARVYRCCCRRICVSRLVRMCLCNSNSRLWRAIHLSIQNTHVNWALFTYIDLLSHSAIRSIRWWLHETWSFVFFSLFFASFLLLLVRSLVTNVLSMLSIGKVNNNEPIFFGGGSQTLCLHPDFDHIDYVEIWIRTQFNAFPCELNESRYHIRWTPFSDSKCFNWPSNSDAIRSVLPSDFCSQLNEQFRSPIFNFYGFDSFLTLVLSPIHSSHKF